MKRWRQHRPITYRIDENGCHICTSHASDAFGYPRVMIHHRNWKIANYLWTQLHGEIPKGKVLRHTCDNPVCINPDHLLIGTQADNMRDMYERGRANNTGNRYGENHPMAKLTEKEVLEILRDKESTQSQLAQKYGVWQTMISAIKTRKNWKHLTPQLGEGYAG